MRYKAIIKNVVGNGFNELFHEFTMFELGNIRVVDFVDCEIEFDETTKHKVLESLRFYNLKPEPIEEL